MPNYDKIRDFPRNSFGRKLAGAKNAKRVPNLGIARQFAWPEACGLPKIANYGKICDFPRNSLGPKRARCQNAQFITKFVISRAIRLARSVRAAKNGKL